MTHYSRAPITEAVIDLKFEGRLSDREFDRLRDRFKRKYPSIEERKTISVQMAVDRVETNSERAGFKMTAENAIDVILINSDSFGSARLAPYDRWENLVAGARSNFETFTKVVGRKQITRIATRFINRFDIPTEKIEGHSFAKFVRVGVSLPIAVSHVIGDYSLAVTGFEVSTGAKFLIQNGTVPPALLDHISISLDIDAYWDSEIPTRIEEIWEKAETLRDAKNAIFENCITDEMRELIQ